MVKGSLEGEVKKVAVCNQVLGSLKSRVSLNCSAVSLCRDFYNIKIQKYNKQFFAGLSDKEIVNFLNCTHKNFP